MEQNCRSRVIFLLDTKEPVIALTRSTTHFEEGKESVYDRTDC